MMTKWYRLSSFLIFLILSFHRFRWIIYQEWSRTDVTKLLNVFSYWTAVSEALIIIVTIISIVIFPIDPKIYDIVYINVNESIDWRSPFYDYSKDSYKKFDKSPITKTSKKDFSVQLSQFAVLVWPLILCLYISPTETTLSLRIIILNWNFKMESNLNQIMTTTLSFSLSLCIIDFLDVLLLLWSICQYYLRFSMKKFLFSVIFFPESKMHEWGWISFLKFNILTLLLN